MKNVEDIKTKNFGQWGKIEELTLRVLSGDNGILLEVDGIYKGNRIIASLHPWTLAMVDECIEKHWKLTKLRTMCGRSLERKLGWWDE